MNEPEMVVMVHNPLVAHVWRLMPGFNVYRNWYLGHGSFVRRYLNVRDYVSSYIETRGAGPAIANLFSATEMLLKAALRAEGVKGAILNDTLLPLLEFCTSRKQRFLNLPGMCCDPRSIHVLNTIRIGAEHGDYRHDQKVLMKSGWKPSDSEEPDPDYLKILDHRLLAPHQMLCGIFNRVDPETGCFAKRWEARSFSDCQTKQHNDKGVWDGEQAPSVPAS